MPEFGALCLELPGARLTRKVLCERTEDKHPDLIVSDLLRDKNRS